MKSIWDTVEEEKQPDPAVSQTRTTPSIWDTVQEEKPAAPAAPSATAQAGSIWDNVQEERAPAPSPAQAASIWNTVPVEQGDLAPDEGLAMPAPVDPGAAVDPNAILATPGQAKGYFADASGPVPMSPEAQKRDIVYDQGPEARQAPATGEILARAKVYQDEAVAAGNTERAKRFIQGRAAVETGLRDEETARAKEAAIRAPYLVVRNFGDGLTLGISKPILAALERANGGRVQAESTSEALAAGAAELLGGVFTGVNLARGIGKLTGAYGLRGASQIIATRMAAAGIQSTLSSLGSLTAQDITGREALGNIAQSMGATLVGILPEHLVRAGAANWLAQVGTDFAYDLATDALLRDRLKDQTFTQWLVTQELPQLIMSASFATKDLMDPRFEAQRQQVLREVRGRFTARAQAKAIMDRTGVSAERAAAIVQEMRGAANEQEAAYILAREVLKSTEQPRQSPSGNTGTVPKPAPTLAELRDQVQRDQMDGELQGMLSELRKAKETASSGNAGLRPQVNERGEITGWINQGRVYPEGMDADTTAALEKFLSGDQLTDRQTGEVEKVIRAIDAERAMFAPPPDETDLPARPDPANTDTANTAEGPKPTSEEGTSRPDRPQGVAEGQARIREVEVEPGVTMRQREDGAWSVRYENGEELDLDAKNPLDAEMIRGAEADLAARETQARAQAAATKLGNKVVMVQTEGDLPASQQKQLQDRKATSGETRGMYDPETDTVYIVARNTTPDDAERVVVHEIVGHRGLRAVLGNRLAGVLDGIYKGRETNRELALIAKAYKLDLADPAQRQEAVEELIALTAERQAKEPGPWKRLLSNIRAGLRAVGFNVEWSDADIANLIAQARKRVSRTAKASAQDQHIRRSVKTSSPVTPEIDRDYIAAVEAGDTAKAQRMVDEAANQHWQSAFQKYADNRRLRRLILDARNPEERTQLVKKLEEINIKYREIALKPYWDAVEPWDLTFDQTFTPITSSLGLEIVQRGDVRTFYRLGKPPEGGRSWNALERKPEDGVSVYITPMKASFVGGSEWWYGKGRVVGFGGDDEPLIAITGKWSKYPGYQQAIKGHHLKSADAVTRDDQGRVRRLSARFNPATPDIRFSKSPTPTPAPKMSMRELAQKIRQEKLAQGLKPRQTSERIANQPGGLGPQVMTRDGAYRIPQNLEQHEAAQAAMGDADLLAAFRDNDNPFRAMDGAAYFNRLEQQRRAARAAGGALAGEDKIRQQQLAFADELAKSATQFGQLLRQMQTLKGTTSAGLVSILKATWTRQGYSVPEPMERQLEGLADDALTARDTKIAAGKTMQANPTVAAIKAYDQAEQAETAATAKWAHQVATLTPKTGPDLIRAFIQGNLLRIPMTHEVNTLSNLIQASADYGADNLSAAAERLVRFLAANAPDQRVRDWGRAEPTMGFRAAPAVGVGRALKAGVRQAVQGPEQIAGSALKGEPDTRDLAPMRAWQQLLSRGSSEMLTSTTTGRVPPVDRVKKLLEGLAVYPAANFRLLALEDLAFKQPRFESTLRQIGIKKGLSGPRLEAFMRMPDEASRNIAWDEALESVYQKAGPVTKAISALMHRGRTGNTVGNYADAVIVTPLVPYFNTLANLFKVTLKLNHPAYALSIAAIHMEQARRAGAKAKAAQETGLPERAQSYRTEQEKANRKAMRDGIGYAVIGMSMNLALAAMYKAGLFRGRSPEDEKERELFYGSGKRPGTMNTTAFARWMASGFDMEAAKEQPGDVWRSMIGFGFLAINAMTVAYKFERNREQGINPDTQGAMERLVNDVMGTLPSTSRALLELPVLMGAQKVLGSLKNPETWVNVFSSWYRGLTAVAVPGYVDQMNRASQLYLPDTRNYLGWERIRKAVQENNPFVDWEEAFPFKRDALGNTIQRTPQGAPFFLFNLLDLTKPVTRPEVVDPMWQEMGKVFRATRQAKAIAGMPDRTYTWQIPAGPRKGLSVKVEIRPEEYEDFIELAGTYRKQYFRQVTQGTTYRTASPDRKADLLSRAWSAGVERARFEWYKKQKATNSAVIQRIADAQATAETQLEP